VKPKSCLFVNPPSPRTVRAMRINYLEFLTSFINGVKADCKVISRKGTIIGKRRHAGPLDQLLIKELGIPDLP
jgi:hypothetical protein